MALLIIVDAATAIQEQTNRRPFPLRISERARERERERERFAGFLQFLVLLQVFQYFSFCLFVC